jgi:hypothetical protein
VRHGLLAATLAVVALVAVAGYALLFSSPQASSPPRPHRHCSLYVAPRSEYPSGHLVICGPAQ